jgi:hypothetical protein
MSQPNARLTSRAHLYTTSIIDYYCKARIYIAVTLPVLHCKRLVFIDLAEPLTQAVQRLLYARQQNAFVGLISVEQNGGRVGSIQI